MPSPDNSVGQEGQAPQEPAGLALLRALWNETLATPDEAIDDTIHELVTCGVVSIRYALLT